MRKKREARKEKVTKNQIVREEQFGTRIQQSAQHSTASVAKYYFFRVFFFRL